MTAMMTRRSVPAAARKHGRLRAFTGPTAEHDAYVAGTYYLAQLFRHPAAMKRCADLGIVNAMGANTDGLEGGFLVPDEMEAALIHIREARGVFPRYARPFSMRSAIAGMPRAIGDTTAYWSDEGAEITEAEPEFGLATLRTRNLACRTLVSSEWSEDSVVEIGDSITQNMAYAQADKIDEAGFNGDGTSTYGHTTGLKAALDSSAINTAATGNTGADTLDLDDFEDVAGMLPSYPGAQPKWFMHPAAFWASAGRLTNAGGGLHVVDLGNGPVLTFLGYEVVFTPVLPSTTGANASTILAYLGDLSLAATVGNRRDVRVEISPDRYFDQDVLGVKSVVRIAINVHERGDTIRNRPIVALKTAAS